MFIVKMLPLFIGVSIGALFGVDQYTSSLNRITTYLVYSILFFLGLDLSNSGVTFKMVISKKRYFLLIPAMIVVGSLVGGGFAGILLDIPLNISLAISSGFGFASLSAAMLMDLHSVEIGTITFLVNFIRWTIGMFTIPYISKYLNKYTSIAPAAATSMSTSIEIIAENTDAEVIAISVVNGLILSLLVPILTKFFYLFNMKLF